MTARRSLGLGLIPIVALAMIGCQEDNNAAVKAQANLPTPAGSSPAPPQNKTYSQYTQSQAGQKSGQNKASGYPGAR